MLLHGVSRERVMLDYRGRFFMPVVLSAIFIAVLAVYYFSLLSAGHIQHGDEYFTLDRAYSFVIRDDFLSVYSENRPTFRKPPLQYWMTALLMRQGAGLEFALRFPSYLFGILTLINVGVLAYLIYPKNPWAVPAAIALLAGAESFWMSNISALLDSGAMLFVTMALAGCLAALRRPQWWYVVAVASGLAALQKAPIPLLFVAGFILITAATRKYHAIDLKAALMNRHFGIAMALTFVAVLFWPALQWAKFGPASFHEAYVNQMAERFSPFGPVDRMRRAWHTVLMSGEPQLRIPAILALLALPWILRRMDLIGLPALLLAFTAAVILTTSYISPRYSLIFLPMLAVALAVVLIELLPGKVLPAVVIAALVFSKWGPVRSAKALGLLKAGQEKYIALLQGIGTSIRADESFVVCRGGVEGRIVRGAISYYASNGHPIYQIRSAETWEALRAKVPPPYRGLCGKSVFDELKPTLRDYRIVQESNDYIHWTSR